MSTRRCCKLTCQFVPFLQLQMFLFQQQAALDVSSSQLAAHAIRGCVTTPFRVCKFVEFRIVCHGFQNVLSWDGSPFFPWQQREEDRGREEGLTLTEVLAAKRFMVRYFPQEFIHIRIRSMQCVGASVGLLPSNSSGGLYQSVTTRLV